LEIDHKRINAPTKTAHRAARARTDAILIALAADGAAATEVLALLLDPLVVVETTTVVRDELPPEGEEEPEPDADAEVGWEVP
jgi:hypothetical protein